MYAVSSVWFGYAALLARLSCAPLLEAPVPRPPPSSVTLRLLSRPSPLRPAAPCWRRWSLTMAERRRDARPGLNPGRYCDQERTRSLSGPDSITGIPSSPDCAPARHGPSLWQTDSSSNQSTQSVSRAFAPVHQPISGAFSRSDATRARSANPPCLGHFAEAERSSRRRRRSGFKKSTNVDTNRRVPGE